MICNFNHAVDFQGNAPVTKQDTWNFSQVICDESLTTPNDFESLIENPDTHSQFKLIKEYSYGDITAILLMGLILFFVVVLTLKKLFLQDEVKINTISQKKF